MRIGFAFLLLALAMAPGLAADQGKPAVVIDAPAATAVLVGPVTVRFHVTGVPATAIAGATVLLDGRALAEVKGPPFEATIDAGDDLRAHRLEVRVRFADGQAATAVRETQRPPATEIEVRLVNIAATVTDRSGRAVMDLGRDDFTVLDAGRPVSIERFVATPAPLAVAVVLDTSFSMQEGERIAAAKHAVESFVKLLQPDDRVGVIAFSDEVRSVLPFTANAAQAATAAVEPLTAAGGTALYDAVFAAASDLGKQPGDHRRVLLLLSDGRDESASGLEPGSFHTLDEAVRKTSDVDATVFSIGLGTLLDRETDFSGRMTTAEVLRRLSEKTGGGYQKVKSGSHLGGAFRDVLDQLRHQYWLAYRPSPAKPGESWRPISVSVSRPGLAVRAREGYFAD